MKGLQVNVYKVIAMCVENGVSLGWKRAHKHDDNPVPGHIMAMIEEAVMQEIFEYFDNPYDCDDDDTLFDDSRLDQ